MQRKTPVKAKEQVTVRGVVAPTEWDMRDEVVAVTLYGHDDAEYIVNNRAMVKRLMKFMDEEVEAHGTLSEDDYGNDVLEVVDFAAVEVDEDDEDEEDGEEFVEAEEEVPAEDWDDDGNSDVEEEEDTEQSEGDDKDWDEGEGGEGGQRRRRRAR